MSSVLEQARVVTELRYAKVCELDQETGKVYLVQETWTDAVVEVTHDFEDAVSEAKKLNDHLSI